MRRRIPILSKCLLLLALGIFAASPAFAVPALQVYIEGANYDQDLETWVSTNSNLKLWVLGNVGEVGTILDVQLAAAHLTSEIGTITITPTTTNLLTDPSTPSAPVLNNAVGGDGTIPVRSDGKSLGSHGIYRDGVSFKQWALGDFDQTDSPIGDFIYGFPSDFPFAGQINVYDIVITGYTMVHFDAFNHVEAANHSLFAPFSHDADGGGELVPEPASLLLVGLGLGGVLSSRVRRRRR